ncbi:MAG: hypothetical protein NVS3B21_18660 [Acidimicrobiales bacterium]
MRNWRTGQVLTYDLDHSDNVYVIGPAGDQRYVLFGQPSISGARVPLGLESFMSSTGLNNERHGQWSASDALTVLAWVTGSPAWLTDSRAWSALPPPDSSAHFVPLASSARRRWALNP